MLRDFNCDKKLLSLREDKHSLKLIDFDLLRIYELYYDINYSRGTSSVRFNVLSEKCWRIKTNTLTGVIKLKHYFSVN